LKVFLDTNVLVAALATRGLCADVLRLVLVHHELVTSAVVVKELQPVLSEKIRLPDEGVARVRELLEAFITPAVAGHEGPPLSIRDESDVAVVRSALAASVDVLVTGDRDLLEADLPIRVLSPRAFWELLRAQSPPDEVHEG
jgi:putative PIN family toxin of toxin-antitoxin system